MPSWAADFYDHRSTSPGKFASFIPIAVYSQYQALAMADVEQLYNYSLEIENSYPDSDSFEPQFKERIFTATRSD